MQSQMQNPSCLLYGPEDARFEDRPLPIIEDPRDVVVRIAYVGVCGSDVCMPHLTSVTPSHARHIPRLQKQNKLQKSKFTSQTQRLMYILASFLASWWSQKIRLRRISPSYGP